ncbi:MAG: hypothetical protein ACRERU_18625 [Methylococcales bacterium]
MVWKEIKDGREWVVDADLKDFFGSVEYNKLLELVAKRNADGRVLRLIDSTLKAGSFGPGRSPGLGAEANGLCLHPDKTCMGDSRQAGQGFDFLGYRFEAGNRGRYARKA